MKTWLGWLVLTVVSAPWAIKALEHLYAFMKEASRG